LGEQRRAKKSKSAALRASTVGRPYGCHLSYRRCAVTTSRSQALTSSFSRATAAGFRCGKFSHSSMQSYTTRQPQRLVARAASAQDGSMT
jgi:hypothetical protein